MLWGDRAWVPGGFAADHDHYLSEKVFHDSNVTQLNLFNFIPQKVILSHISSWNFVEFCTIVGTNIGTRITEPQHAAEYGYEGRKRTSILPNARRYYD